MTQLRVQELLDVAVMPSALRPNGALTIPPSWGVYRITPDRQSATRRFRYGNHPIRQLELHTQFGSVRPVALFTARALAAELASLLNAGHKL
jgi:hypothetical protein